MRRIVGIVGQLAIVLGAHGASHSTSGFLITWLGLAIALDKYVCRWLPWQRPVVLVKEFLLRGGYFGVGAVAAALARPGLVPWWEAVYVGAMLGLAILVVEALFEITSPQTECTWRRRVVWGCCFVGLIALLTPPILTLHPLHTVPKRTPAAFGFAFDDVRVPASGGVTLAAWVVPHPEARGNVIFCHGHGRNRGHVAGVLQTLRDLRLNVIAFDFRGHGDSPGHTATFGVHEVDDLVAVAGYMRQRFPGQPLFLVGVSYGAAVALQALPRLSDVQGVWSEACFARFDDVMDGALAPLPRLLRKPLEALYTRLAWLDTGMWSSDIRPVEFGGGAHVPICFCHGDADQLARFDQAQALYDAYTGPKSCYWVPGGSHYHVRQDDRDEYRRRLCNFFEESLSHAPTAAAGSE